MFNCIKIHTFGERGKVLVHVLPSIKRKKESVGKMVSIKSLFLVPCIFKSIYQVSIKPTGKEGDVSGIIYDGELQKKTGDFLL